MTPEQLAQLNDHLNKIDTICRRGFREALTSQTANMFSDVHSEVLEIRYLLEALDHSR